MKKLLVLAATAAACSVLAANASAVLRPGVYQTVIRGASPALLNGTWQLSMNGAGYAVTRNKAAAIAGTLTIVGNKITFTDLTGSFACRGAQQKGTYTWSLKGKTLTLKPVSEPCAGRKAVLSRPFTKLA